jgi:integrase
VAEPREVKPGTFALRAYVGRSPTGNARFLHETYVHHRKDSGLAEARRRQRGLEERARQERAASTTFGALLDDWMAHAHRLGRSPTTLANYEIRVRVIKTGLGAHQLDELSAKDLDRWYGDLQKAGRSPADIRAFHRIVSAALSQGERWDVVDRNVARRATLPHVPDAGIAPPTPDEVSTLIRMAERSRTPEMASIIFFAALTGLRRGELCALRWDRVDWPGATIRVDQAVWQVSGEIGDKDTKTHQARTLGVGEIGTSLLKARRGRAVTAAEVAGVELESDGFVWSSDEAGRRPWKPDRLTQAFGRLRDAAAKADGRTWPPYRLHDLRHYSATELLGAGVDVATVSERLGHAMTSTTLNIYSHGRVAHDQRGADILGDVLTRAIPSASS